VVRKNKDQQVEFQTFFVCELGKSIQHVSSDATLAPTSQEAAEV
jgi:hypothetical protein